MKILLLNQAFVSPDEPGHTRHFEMAKFLRARGHELVIVASDLNYQTGQRTIARKGVFAEQIIEGVKKDNVTKTQIFVFGVGNDVNAHLLDRLAEGYGAAQDYPRARFEVLVIDGQSTDQTKLIISRFAAESTVDLRLLQNARYRTAPPTEEALVKLLRRDWDLVVREQRAAYGKDEV